MAISDEDLQRLRRVAPLPITIVAPGVVVDGPAQEFVDTMKALYEAKFRP